MKFLILNFVLNNLVLEVLVLRRLYMVSKLESMLVELEEAQGTSLSQNIREKYALVFKRGSNHGYFDFFYKNRDISEPLALYSTRKGRFISKPFIYDNFTYFILDPAIEADENYKYHYFVLTSDGCVDENILNIFYKILLELKSNDVSNYKNKKIAYRKASYPDCTLVELAKEDLYTIRVTHHRKHTKYMEEIANVAKALPRNYKKSEFVEAGVGQLIALLRKMGILMEDVDLTEHPDFVPLVFPFPFVRTNSPYWSRAELFNFGFDLRGVKGSKFEKYFDMKIVDEICRSCGLFVDTFQL